MGDALAQVNQWLDVIFNYGTFWVYLAIFLACFVENLFPPFPGDSFIVAAGGLAALGRLDPWIAFVIVNTGGILSVMVMYYFGRKYGRDYFIRRDFKYFSAADIRGVEVRLSKWGAWILLVSRFVVGFRSALAVATGIGKYPAGKMFVFSLGSYFAFTGLLIYIGLKLVENLGVIEKYFDRYNQVVWPVLIALTLWYIVNRYLKSKKTEQ